MNELFVRFLLAELHKSGYCGAHYSDAQQSIQVLRNFSSLQIFYEDDAYRIRHSDHSRGICDNLKNIIENVSIMFAAWESAASMDALGVPQFRKLLEWNNTVLAARDDGNKGLYFVTWQYTHGKTGVGIGNYVANFRAAMRDFVRRSDLLYADTVFNMDELTMVHEALQYQFENDGSLYLDRSEKIQQIIRNLDLVREVESHNEFD